VAGKKWRHFAGEVTREAHKKVSVSLGSVQFGEKNGAIVQARCEGWHPKKDVLFKCPGGHKKISSVCRRNVDGGTQKIRNFAGELPNVAPKNLH
jgi:hypothetical protein